MGDLVLFTPSKKSQIVKLEDLLKGLLRNGINILPKKCQLFERNYNMWATQSLLRTGEFVLSHQEVG